MTVICGNYEWDSEKNERNRKKHGLCFEEILDAFDDPFFLEKPDTEHSTLEEERYIGLGSIKGVVIVTSIYTERERTRIISSRLASKREEAEYYERRKNFKG